MKMSAKILSLQTCSVIGIAKIFEAGCT